MVSRMIVMNGFTSKVIVAVKMETHKLLVLAGNILISTTKSYRL